MRSEESKREKLRPKGGTRERGEGPSGGMRKKEREQRERNALKKEKKKMRIQCMRMQFTTRATCRTDT